MLGLHRKCRPHLAVTTRPGRETCRPVEKEAPIKKNLEASRAKILESALARSDVCERLGSPICESSLAANPSAEGYDAKGHHHRTDNPQR